MSMSNELFNIQYSSLFSKECLRLQITYIFLQRAGNLLCVRITAHKLCEVVARYAADVKVVK